MTVLKVTKDNEEIEEVRSAGEEFKSPVQITFTIEEELYKKLLNTADFLKETPYDILLELCEKAERFVTF